MTTQGNRQERNAASIDLRRATAQERLSWGEKIRELREARGMLQSELAEAAGISVRTLGSIERGQVAGQADKLERVLTILGIEARQSGYSDFTEQQVAIYAPLLDAIPVERRAEISAKVLKILVDAIRPASSPGGTEG